jgi:hypothetical protein
MENKKERSNVFFFCSLNNRIGPYIWLTSCNVDSLALVAYGGIGRFGWLQIMKHARCHGLERAAREAAHLMYY